MPKVDVPDAGNLLRFANLQMRLDRCQRCCVKKMEGAPAPVKSIGVERIVDDKKINCG